MSTIDTLKFNFTSQTSTLYSYSSDQKATLKLGLAQGPSLGLSLKSNVPLFSGQKSVLLCTNLWHMILTQFLWTMAGKNPLTLPITRANQGLVRAYPWHGQNSSFLSCNKTVPCWTDSKFWCVHLTKWLGFYNLWTLDSIIPQVLTPRGLGLTMPKKCAFKINTKLTCKSGKKFRIIS